MLESRKIADGRPTRDEALALDDRILDVAGTIFMARGYGGASMTAIAAEARVGKQTLYRRYPDKASLFRTVVNDRIAAAAGTPEISVNEADPIAELRQITRSAFEAVMDDRLIAFHRILVAEVGTFKELAAYAGQWGSLHIERCVEAIGRASRAGFEIAGDHRVTATSLLWGVVGDVLYRTMMGEAPPATKAERDRLFAAKWAVSIFGSALRPR